MKFALIRPICTDTGPFVGYGYPLKVPSSRLLESLVEAIKKIDSDLLISSEAICGGEPIDASYIAKTLSGVDKNRIINIFSKHDSFFWKYLFEWWKQIIQGDIDKIFVCPSQADNIFSKSPFPLNRNLFEQLNKKSQNSYSIDFKEVFSATSYTWINNQATMNSKINQELPYPQENVFYKHALSTEIVSKLNDSHHSGFYGGAYPKSWISLNAGALKESIKVHLFLRICMDVELGPTFKELDAAKNLKGPKIFIIQGGSFTAKRFFGDNVVMCGEIGMKLISEFSGNKDLFEDFFPKKISIPYLFWKEDATAQNVDSFYSELYFNFLSEFNYVIFADCKGPLDRDDKYGDQAGCIYKITKKDKDLFFEALSPIKEEKPVKSDFFGYSTYELPDIFVEDIKSMTSSLEAKDKANFSSSAKNNPKK